MQAGQDGARNVFAPLTETCANNNLGSAGMLYSCLSDPNEFKYLSDGQLVCPWLPLGSTQWDGGTDVAISGPNLNCPTAMLGLSSDPAQLYAKLDHMYPVPAGTQVDVGLMWGLRALSNRDAWANFWGLPLSEKAAEFDDFDTRKVMILLTDGANRFPIHYEGYYGCLEAGPLANRQSAGDCRRDPNISIDSGGSIIQDFDRANASLDALTMDACAAIRDDYNVELYVIALDLANPAAVSKLQACAGDPSKFFSVASADLDDVFADLAAESLRLTR